MTDIEDYYCENCDAEFYVNKDKDPNCCPFCGSEEIGWSHEIKL